MKMVSWIPITMALVCLWICPQGYAYTEEAYDPSPAYCEDYSSSNYCDGYASPLCNWSFSGEFLYWKPTMGGTDFALPTSVGGGAPVPGTTSPEGVSFQFTPGVRVGAYYLPECSDWTFSFTAAYLPSSVKDSKHGVLYPLQAIQGGLTDPSFTFDYAASAQSDWALHYWVFDLRLAKDLCLGHCFMASPYCGLRSALIHQTWNIIYDGVHDLSPNLHTITVNTKNQCNALGIQGGLRGEWFLNCGLSLVGDFSAGLTYGWFHVKDVQGGQGGLSRVLNFTNHFSQLVPMVDGLLGISWSRSLACRCVHHVEVLLGYQMQYWWRVNQLPHFTDSSSPNYAATPNDLGVQGLTLGAWFDF